MPAMTPSFLWDLESNMRLITTNEYGRLASQLWWEKIGKRVTSVSKKERITWLLETAKIEKTIRYGGQMIFEDIVTQSHEYENENAVAGLKLKKEQFEDLDGNGVNLATHWSKQVGAYAAYWPQKLVADALRRNPVTYDGLTFFHTAHLPNPFNVAAGTFSNDFTGAASATNPGALPIHAVGAGNVTADVAVNNLAAGLAYVASIKMPNGEDPRFLRLAYIFAPPALAARVQQITNAKFIAQAATGGAAVGDIEAVIRNFGLGQPIIIPELGAAFGGSDTTYYLGMEELASNELGAFVYVDREPFSIIYHGPQTDAQLARIREFQWTTEGRNVVAPGHPYLLIRVQAT